MSGCCQSHQLALGVYSLTESSLDLEEAAGAADEDVLIIIARAAQS